MSDWAKKIKDKAKGLFAEAEQELTVLEGGDTVDLTADATDDEPDSTLEGLDSTPEERS